MAVAVLSIQHHLVMGAAPIKVVLVAGLVAAQLLVIAIQQARQEEALPLPLRQTAALLTVGPVVLVDLTDLAVVVAGQMEPVLVVRVAQVAPELVVAAAVPY